VTLLVPCHPRGISLCGLVGSRSDIAIRRALRLLDCGRFGFTVLNREEVIMMRTDNVEILSDRTNAAVMRHPGRKYPGVLVQGDTLHSLCQRADAACRDIGRSSAGFDEANELRNALQSLLAHYKSVLREHDVPLPFSDQPV
jgi:hypothetical protein